MNFTVCAQYESDDKYLKLKCRKRKTYIASWEGACTFNSVQLWLPFCYFVVLCPTTTQRKHTPKSCRKILPRDLRRALPIITAKGRLYSARK